MSLISCWDDDCNKWKQQQKGKMGYGLEQLKQLKDQLPLEDELKDKFKVLFFLHKVRENFALQNDQIQNTWASTSPKPI